MNVLQTKYGMLLVLSTVSLLFWLMLLRRSRTRGSKINIDDLFLGPDNKLSKSAIVMFGAFIVTSTVVVYQLFKGTLTNEIFLYYGTFWIAPSIASTFASRPQPPATQIAQANAPGAVATTGDVPTP